MNQKSLHAGLADVLRSKQPLYGTIGNNPDAGAATLRSPSTMDFRLKLDTRDLDAERAIRDVSESFHETASDIGAHELLDADWQAGYKMHSE